MDPAPVARERVEAAVARLAEARRAAGMSQYRLAELSGVSREMVRLVEAGESVPSLHTFVVLCLALGRDPADLLVG